MAIVLHILQYLGFAAFPAGPSKQQHAAPATAPTAAGEALLGALWPAVVADAECKGRQHQKTDEVATEAAGVAAEPGLEGAAAAAAAA